MDIELLFKAEFIGEVKGINQCLDMIKDCVYYSEEHNKNVINGDMLINLIKARREILILRQTRHV